MVFKIIAVVLKIFSKQNMFELHKSSEESETIKHFIITFKKIH